MRVCDYPDWHVDVSWRRALKRGFFELSFSSSTMHMSHTFLGRTLDDDNMAVICYVGYQMLVSTFNTTDPIVLSMTNNNQVDAREIAERFM